MTDEELKPCPWCGENTAEIYEKHNTAIYYRSGMKAEIISVEVQHWCPPTHGQPSPRMIARVGRDRVSAIAAWNRRNP